ncbi:hypothetical protein D3C72_1109730 [compost metagenome]
MNGCARRRATSSTRTRVRRVPRARSTGAFSSHSTGLDSSRYQSQYWFQMNSYSAWLARSKRNCSSWRVTSASVRCSCEMIQRSASDSS